MVIHTSFADFILFVYIHIAHIDNSYDPKEMSTIKSRMNRLFPEGTDIERKLYQGIREYSAFDKTQFHDLIRDSFAFFKNDEDANRSTLYSDLQAIMEADGKVDPSEAEALNKIRKFMNKE